MKLSIPANVIRAAAQFCSSDELRVALTFIQVRHRSGNIELWATDAHRMLKYKRPHAEHFPEFFLRGEDVKAAKIGKREHEITFNESGSIDGRIKATKKDDAGFRFPDCEAVWPEPSKMADGMDFKVGDMANVLKMTSYCAGAENACKFNFKRGLIEAKDFQYDIETQAKIPANFQESLPPIWFDGKLLSETIRLAADVFGNDNVIMAFRENNPDTCAATIRPHFDCGAEVLVMPIMGYNW